MSDDRSPIYSNLADDEEIGEIIVLYANEMPERAARLQKELDARNWTELQGFVHQIKGSAGSHGFPTVSAVAKELDNLLKTDGAEDAVVEMTRHLIGMCLRVKGTAGQ